MIESTPNLVLGEDGLARPLWASTNQLLRDYYDHEWGLPIYDEAELFERLSLEAFQAGLSWELVLRKRPAFRSAFADFDPDEVATFDNADIERLCSEPAIIRNRRKIEAVINNARATIDLREHGGLSQLIWSHRPAETPMPVLASDIPTQSPESQALARALKSHGFTFVGPTTMFALMGAIGVVDIHLLGAHRRGSSGVWR
ncbi:DNA-3-methyladenine glycosylase I [Corynebacterium alimapuense]|uniref:3-methyladenine DNA glycosylase n=1 Tax=Corynebacterium alimapuense TaxID=1576874 RepID=A0A3M8K6A4_9CORY|nr:DNA-3-methyladenine glycosylase I [Corynebacterium alimapuense]RNE48696.1 3-methyladenine DNA glycosylase [Corynebacterium alimapuense]